MQSDAELPTDVIGAIQANRKIDAIKRLREHWGIGLKEAKQAVDAYIPEQPQSTVINAPRAESDLGRLILIVVLIGGAFSAYSLFS